MISTLEKYYVSKGFSLPKFSYISYVDEKGSKMYCAEMILPNGITIRGDPRHTFIEVCFSCYYRIIDNWIYFNYL